MGEQLSRLAKSNSIAERRRLEQGLWAQDPFSFPKLSSDPTHAVSFSPSPVLLVAAFTAANSLSSFSSPLAECMERFMASIKCTVAWTHLCDAENRLHSLAWLHRLDANYKAYEADANGFLMDAPAVHRLDPLVFLCLKASFGCLAGSDLSAAGIVEKLLPMKLGSSSINVLASPSQFGLSGSVLAWLQSVFNEYDAAFQAWAVARFSLLPARSSSSLIPTNTTDSFSSTTTTIPLQKEEDSQTNDHAPPTTLPSTPVPKKLFVPSMMLVCSLILHARRNLSTLSREQHLSTLLRGIEVTKPWRWWTSKEDREQTRDYVVDLIAEYRLRQAGQFVFSESPSSAVFPPPMVVLAYLQVACCISPSTPLRAVCAEMQASLAGNACYAAYTTAEEKRKGVSWLSESMGAMLSRFKQHKRLSPNAGEIMTELPNWRYTYAAESADVQSVKNEGTESNWSPSKALQLVALYAARAATPLDVPNMYQYAQTHWAWFWGCTYEDTQNFGRWIRDLALLRPTVVAPSLSSPSDPNRQMLVCLIAASKYNELRMKSEALLSKTLHFDANFIAETIHSTGGSVSREWLDSLFEEEKRLFCQTFCAPSSPTSAVGYFYLHSLAERPLLVYSILSACTRLKNLDELPIAVGSLSHVMQQEKPLAACFPSPAVSFTPSSSFDRLASRKSVKTLTTLDLGGVVPLLHLLTAAVERFSENHHHDRSLAITTTTTTTTTTAVATSTATVDANTNTITTTNLSKKEGHQRDHNKNDHDDHGDDDDDNDASSSLSTRPAWKPSLFLIVCAMRGVNTLRRFDKSKHVLQLVESMQDNTDRDILLLWKTYCTAEDRQNAKPWLEGVLQSARSAGVLPEEFIERKQEKGGKAEAEKSKLVDDKRSKSLLPCGGERDSDKCPKSKSKAPSLVVELIKDRPDLSGEWNDNKAKTVALLGQTCWSCSDNKIHKLILSPAERPHLAKIVEHLVLAGNTIVADDAILQKHSQNSSDTILFRRCRRRNL
jgi:hypothetical protein